MALDTEVADSMLAEIVGWQFLDDTHRAIQAGVKTWLRCGRSIALERCIGLPSASASGRAERDRWLRAAADAIRLLDPGADVVTAISLEQSRFLRSQWRAWRDLVSPPEGSSALRAGLFFVARQSAGRGLSKKQIRRILNADIFEA